MHTHALSPRRRHAGFTLVELMVAVVIGMVTTLVITQVLAFSEGQKRSTTSGADAQVNGSLALYSLQHDLQIAGYGFASSRLALGCEVHARYNGAEIATGAGAVTFPTSLVPVIIDSTNADRNTVRVIASSKTSYSIPTRIIPPSYDPATASKKEIFPVNSALGIAQGDITVATKNAADQPCEAFRVSADPTVIGTIDRKDDAQWNAAGFPTAIYSDGDALINLGSLIDRTYSVSADYTLQETEFALDAATGQPSYTPVRDLFPNIVAMRAMYGKDTNADGVVDTYDQVTPTTNAQWQQVLAVRVVLVARSSQYEKDEVTSANPLWDVGTATTVSPAPVACGASKCVTIHVDTPTDWKHYRYKVYDTVVPLRNMIWS